MRRFAAVQPLVSGLLAWIALAAPVAAQNAAVAEAEPTTLALASMFTDHMVLQRDMEVPVWGEAEPGAEVTASLDDETVHTMADGEGHWHVDLPSMEAGGPHELSIKAGDDSITLSDVLVGDVWVAAGQSNMEWPVVMADNAEAEIATADWPDIRAIDVPNQVGEKPRNEFESAGWQACTPATAGAFSAVAYYFARDLHKELGVPIGIVGCNWGGTRMEAWTSREALLSSETFAPLVEADDKPPANDEEAKARAGAAPHRPAALFNGMTAAVAPYGIRGVIWYQGESNAGMHHQYAELSKLMIADWRNRWGQGDFPFLLVQLAGWENGGDSWPFLREAQADTLETPNTAMAVAVDIGDRTDIHPRNKQEVGRRLALAARAVAYGEDVVYSGPVFRELAVEDGKARVSFDHAGGGLKVIAAKRSEPEGGADAEPDAAAADQPDESEGEGEAQTLKGFEIAGVDGKFVPAKAEIDGAQVVVSSADVSEPTQVRYDWSAFPGGNLYNAEGLPAVPFRSAR